MLNPSKSLSHIKHFLKSNLAPYILLVNDQFELMRAIETLVYQLLQSVSNKFMSPLTKGTRFTALKNTHFI